MLNGEIIETIVTTFIIIKVRLNSAFHRKVGLSIAFWEHENAYWMQSQTPYLMCGACSYRFCMMFILCFDILLYHLPPLPHTSMEAARRPEMLAAPLLEMREFLSQDSARTVCLSWRSSFRFPMCCF
jgi:hypothetical protein